MQTSFFTAPFAKNCKGFRALQTASRPEDRECSPPFALAPGGDGINLHGGPIEPTVSANPREQAARASKAPPRNAVKKAVRLPRSFGLWMLVCLYVCLYVCMYVCLFVCLFVSLSVCMFVCLFVCMFVCLLVCLYDCMFVCLYVCLFVCLLVCLLWWLWWSLLWLLWLLWLLSLLWLL